MDAYGSALHTLPVVYAMMPRPPLCVLDIGCGDGEWLQAVQDLDENALVLGIDQKARPATLNVLQHMRQDLRNLNWVRDVLPVRSKWDLVICVEVAEHLHPQFAEGLVWMVSQFSDTVLFGAAHPGQGPYGEDDNAGMHHNEQPVSYWRDLFDVQGFDYRDLSPMLNTPEGLQYIDPWYRANTGLYIRTH